MPCIAERAQSLSPSKDTSSIAGTPGSARSKNDMPTQEEQSRTPSLQPVFSRGLSSDDHPPKANGVTAVPAPSDPTQTPRGLPQPPSKPQTLSSASPQAAAPSARTGTLSWQQRPSSRGSAGSRTRPLSMLVSEKDAARSSRQSAEPPAVRDDDMSMAQIAQSLGSRDPSWFRQTQERGTGSAALRRNQVEDTPDMAPATENIRLPGMSRESTAEPESRESRMSPPPESVRSSTTSIEGSVRSNLGSSHEFSNPGSVSFRSGIRSPLPAMASQRFEPPSSDTISTSGDDASSVGRSLAMSPSQGRISPERTDRPTSPTKGLGGFVQSAMLKRSDSVNKRWSAQAGPGLSRGNSTASNLSAYGGPRYPLASITPLTESRPNSVSREGSPTSHSRPSSSHSKAPALQRLSENDRPGTFTAQASSVSQPPIEERPSFRSTRESKSPTPPEEIVSPPPSPSKRWSPTKSSWLENAINKPDSPRIKLPAAQQPAWMAEINRAKQVRGSIDAGKGSYSKDVAASRLIRRPQGAGFEPPNSGAPATFHNAGAAEKPRNDSGGGSDLRSASPHTEDVTTTTTSPKGPPRSKQNDGADSKPKVHADIITAPDPTSSPSTKPAASPTGRHRVSSSSVKAKPETPPKRDFKSTLRPRQTSGVKKIQEEPEFKNVFGNLKRTQTKNYIAPNELKDNILRGKAELTQTGGPKKTERRDELKESILQRKQGMVVPSASTKITSASSNAQEQSPPEAIAKRRGLVRSESIPNNGSTTEEPKISGPEALAKLQYLRDKPKPTTVKKQSAMPTNSPKGSNSDDPSIEGFPASLAGILQRGPSPLVNKPSLTPSPDGDRTQVSAKASKPQAPSGGPQLTHATKARARGPKRRLPTASTQQVLGNAPQDEPDTEPEISSHETKTIKRPPSPKSPNKPEPQPLSNITHLNIDNRKASQPVSPRKPSTTILPPPSLSKPTSDVAHVAIDGSPSQTPPPNRQKPLLSPKGANVRQLSVPAAESPADPSTKRHPAQASERKLANPVTEKEGKSRPQSPVAQLPSVKGAAATWGRSSNPTQPSRARSPIKLPTRKDEEAALEQAGIITNGAMAYGSMAPANGAQAATTEMPPSQVARSPGSPPIPGTKPSSIAGRVTTTSLPSPATAQSKQLSDSPISHESGLFAEIFDETSSSKHKISINTQAVLDSCSSRDSSAKIKTLRKQIFEIAENGKLVPVPTHQEHILFDRSNYLCSHVFGNHAGQRTTEVYLWHGDAAPASAVENALVVAKKFAKDHSGKLVVLEQGKETANFFQALGGIVITRRGSAGLMGAATGSRDRYILCGRQHVGQIAFDEVDYSLQSFCKGFPYIVCTPSGKLFLWKGSGSGADELGCARLIGMDLGLTGEIEEIDEGREPDAFWEALSGSGPDRAKVSKASGQHWQLKPSCENYTTRLFNVNFGVQRPKSASGFIQGAMQWGRRGSAPANDPDTAKTANINEVNPFAQSDLVDDGVFVLDTFFEVFV